MNLWLLKPYPYGMTDRLDACVRPQCGHIGPCHRNNESSVPGIRHVPCSGRQTIGNGLSPGIEISLSKRDTSAIGKTVWIGFTPIYRLIAIVPSSDSLWITLHPLDDIFGQITGLGNRIGISCTFQAFRLHPGNSQ